MYYFKEVEKAKILQGRTITYLAENKIHITRAYLTSILSGKRGCSIRVADRITQCISRSAKLEDYFVREED